MLPSSPGGRGVEQACSERKDALGASLGCPSSQPSCLVSGMVGRYRLSRRDHELSAREGAPSEFTRSQARRNQPRAPSCCSRLALCFPATTPPSLLRLTYSFSPRWTTSICRSMISLRRTSPSSSSAPSVPQAEADLEAASRARRAEPGLATEAGLGRPTRYVLGANPPAGEPAVKLEKRMSYRSSCDCCSRDVPLVPRRPFS